MVKRTYRQIHSSFPKRSYVSCDDDAVKFATISQFGIDKYQELVEKHDQAETLAMAFFAIAFILGAVLGAALAICWSALPASYHDVLQFWIIVVASIVGLLGSVSAFYYFRHTSLWNEFPEYPDSRYRVTSYLSGTKELAATDAGQKFLKGYPDYLRLEVTPDTPAEFIQERYDQLLNLWLLAHIQADMYDDPALMRKSVEELMAEDSEYLHSHKAALDEVAMLHANA